MDNANKIDPESYPPLAGLLEIFPGGFNAIADINQRRATVQQITSSGEELPDNPEVTITRHFTEGQNGDPAVELSLIHI